MAPEVARLARPSLGEGVTLDLDVAVAGGELLLDPDAVQDSLLNLILNARDAMAPAGGGAYKGKVLRPADDKIYNGKAQVNGKSMQLSGCVAGGLICKSQTWTKLK